MKKRISLFLVFAMLVTLLVPLAVTTVSADEPTLITDQASFVSAIATNSTKDADGKATGTFKLANDITISGEWNFTTVFRGELDGDGHTITFADGATITSGLFAMVSANAYIHDLSIVQAGSATWVPQTASGCVNSCLGSVAGLSGAGAVNGINSWGNKDYTSSAANKVRIENVTVTVNMDVSGSATGVSVGGIVGEIGLYTEITNCVFNGYISDATNRSDTSNQDSGSKRSAYGGIAGFGFRQAVVVITECINNGNITGYGQEGGILGAISPAWNANETFITTTIQRCINNGTITCNLTASAGGAGGISAYLYGRRVAGTTVNVLNNINNGTIAKAEGDAYIAGIVARVNRKENINVVTFAGNLQLSEDVGGGSQIMNHADGSGDDGVLVYTNNFGRSAGNSTYSPLSDAASYQAAYATLDTAYPDVYVFINNEIGLAWATSGAVVGEYVMITNQASFVSAIATDSIKDIDGKATGKFKLAKDITISGEWNFTTVFRGELDGDGHTITFADGATVNGGLFQVVGANAYIHDLQIAQVGTVTWTLQPGLSGSVNACLGGVVGFSAAGAVNGTNSWGNKDYTSSAANKVRIENVTVTVNMDVTGSTPNASVGGIVGEVGLYTEITNCVFNGYISDATNRYDSSNGDSKSSQDTGNSSRSAYGGIVGFGFRQAVVVITECINNGNITGYGQEGGILGAISPAWNANETFITTTIQRCINNGTITCNGTDITSSVAGIAAYLYGRRVAGTTVNVLNNINNGTIAKAEGDAYIAGIVARVNRKEDKNVVTFAGNLQLSEDVGGGSQIMNHADGSGDDGVLVYTNNFGRSAGNSTYSPLTYTKNYVDAYIALNAAYADTYVFRNNKVTLAWADDAVFNTVTSMIGAQLSNVAGETRSIRMVAGTTDDLTVDTVGVDVKVYYGTEGASRGFTGDTDTVYTSVYAAGVPVTAASQGVDYLYTATLENVPTSIGTVTLLIRTFHEKGDETYYSDYTAMTLDLAS